ncbi:hypothetical protein C2E23DRAFT_83538 [Lenzites betulinus]|nr:hypothetical protein C2E23DRAFT_83538 [Lenzites betulinus]
MTCRGRTSAEATRGSGGIALLRGNANGQGRARTREGLAVNARASLSQNENGFRDRQSHRPSASAPDQSSRSPASRARTPSSPKRRLTSQPPLPASGPSSPYKVERSRPIRPASPGEIGPSPHPPPRARRERSPVDSERRWASSRRSPTPDRRRRYGPGGAGPSRDYRERERRPSRRRSKSPSRRRSKSPPRRRTPPPRKRTPTPPSRSRSRTRSPTQTPPPKRHVLPPTKSPSRLTPPPPLPLIATPIESKAEPDGDVKMGDASEELEPASSASVAPEPALMSAPLSTVASRLASPAQAGSAPASSPIPTTPTLPSLPPKPEPEVDQKPVRKRRSKSPPTGPRMRGPISQAVAGTPPHVVQPVPSLPLKPDWARRNTASHPVKTESPAPPASAAAESSAPSPALPVYQPRSSASSEIMAEIARIRTQRLQIDREYVQVATATQRALQEYDLSTIDLRMAEKRREIAEAAIEKAEIGMLGMDNVSLVS